MRPLRTASPLLPVLAPLLLSVSLSGCLWLAIPSLAYQGYQYEHKEQSAEASSRAKQHHHATPTPTPETE